MVVDFQANSPIERAFTQAIAWETGRLWSEVSRNRQKENWDAFFGESFCLAYRCALTHLNNHLNTITTGMIDSIRNLNDQQKQSVFNVAIQVVEWTLEIRHR